MDVVSTERQRARRKKKMANKENEVAAIKIKVLLISSFFKKGRNKEEDVELANVSLVCLNYQLCSDSAC